MGIREDWLTPYRLRTVRIGVVATFLVLGSLVGFLVLPSREQGIETIPFVVVISIGAAAALGIAALPWRRLFERGIGLGAMYLWSIADIVLITLLIGYGGGAGLRLFFLYAFTTVFWAASYPRRGQLWLLLFTYACYLPVLAVRGWPVGPGDIVLHLGLLGALSYMSDFLSKELRGQIEAHHLARAESERRASMLATVAEAARRLQDLESESVLQAVVDAGLDLGFDAGHLAMFSDDVGSYAVVHSRGLPESFVNSVQPATMGITSLLVEQRRTVVVDDYERFPRGHAEIQRMGFHGVIATPIWRSGRLVAALMAGTREDRAITAQELEAFELLAALAGRALENADRFQRERRTVERLAEVDRVKNEFVATASHELRTPLTAIIGMGLTLEQQWDRIDDAARRDFLARLNANATTLEEIVTTLLDFSRLDAGHMEVRRRPVRLDELVRAVVSRLATVLRWHRVTVSADPVSASVDPVLIERVVENLLSNAVKHTPPGTPVRISARMEQGKAVVEVADEGPGIASADLQHLGDRFFRGGNANTRRTRGTGLGLALVHELLALHGCTLEVSSEPGRGARFSFALPADVPSPLPLAGRVG